jgi:hypothetical protein
MNPLAEGFGPTLRREGNAKLTQLTQKDWARLSQHSDNMTIFSGIARCPRSRERRIGGLGGFRLLIHDGFRNFR